MPSKYLLQIVHRTSGEVVQFEPGLSTEINFIDDCVQRILSKGVGVFRTNKHVEQDIRDGINEAVHSLKLKVKP